MLMLKAFRNRSIVLLWCGQATSTIGDEIYRVALIWLAVGLIGPDTGYLPAAQCAALIALSLLGGGLAARWDAFRTMIAVDVLRGLIVLVPVAVWLAFHAVGLPVLLSVAVLLAGLSAFFDPALVTMVPRFAHDIESLQAANGLMSTTYRLGRAIGPGFVGLLTLVVSQIHFFTIDALTFFVSAASIAALRASYRDRRAHPRPAAEPRGLKEEAAAEFSKIRSDRLMVFLLAIKALGNGFWSLAYTLGLALYVHQTAPGDLSAYGGLIASYGIGNLAGALLLGNMRRRRPLLIIYNGYITMGLGFAAMGLVPNIRVAAAAALWAGFWGPFNDMPFIDLLLSRYSIHDIPKLHRLRIALETGMVLVFLLVSPALFRAFSAQAVVGASGVGLVSLGLAGFAFFPRLAPRRAASQMPAPSLE